MSRGAFGLISLLVALALGAALWTMNANRNGPTSQTAQHPETQARQAAATANFSAAALQLETFRAESGTYLGATLPASFGVTLARAEASSYCLQAGTGAAMQHLTGPGGQPAAGGC